MIEQLDGVHCPVCGKCIIRAKGAAEMGIVCDRCNSDIEIVINGDMVSVIGHRKIKKRNSGNDVSVSIAKHGNGLKKAANM